MKIGEPRRAVEDLNKAVELDPHMAAFFARALVHRHLGQYEQARKDFDRGEAIDPKQWEDDVFGLFYQADTHARLGDGAAALAYCARLPDDFWTPGVYRGSRRGQSGDRRQTATHRRGFPRQAAVNASGKPNIQRCRRNFRDRAAACPS